MFRLFGRESDRRDGLGQDPEAVDRTASPVGTASVGPKDKQRSARPKTWLFRGYQLVREPRTGFWCVHENRDRLNEATGLYEPNEKPIRTAIAVPETCWPDLAADQLKGQEVVAFCEAVRRRLDQSGGEGGLKLLFDCRYGRDGQPAGWQPKWKHQSEPPAASGDPFARRLRHVSERLLLVARDNWDPSSRHVDDPDLMPNDLFQLACGYWDMRSVGQRPAEYWKTPLWRDWFGKAIQRKREAVISEELSCRFMTLEPTVSVPAGGPDEALTRQALDAARNLLPLFRHINRLPGDRAALLTHLINSVSTVIVELGGSIGSDSLADIVRTAAETAITETEGHSPGVVIIELERQSDGTATAALFVHIRRLVAEALAIPSSVSVPAAPTPADIADRIANGVTNSVLAVRRMDALEFDEAGAKLIVRDWRQFSRAVANMRRRIAGF